MRTTLVWFSILAAGCIAERERVERDMSIAMGDLRVAPGDLSGPGGDLRGADLRPTSDGNAASFDLVANGDQGIELDLAVSGDLRFPMTDLVTSALTPGDTCADAPALPLGVLVEGQTTDDPSVHDDYHFWGQLDLGASACDDVTGFQYDGPDTVYKVDVPPGQTLRVQAQSQLGWDLTVALFTDCAMPAASCVADADDALPVGNPEEVQYTNTTSDTLTVFVLIDGWDTPEKGTYRISAVLQ